MLDSTKAEGGPSQAAIAVNNHQQMTPYSLCRSCNLRIVCSIDHYWKAHQSKNESTNSAHCISPFTIYDNLNNTPKLVLKSQL